MPLVPHATESKVEVRQCKDGSVKKRKIREVSARVERRHSTSTIERYHHGHGPIVICRISAVGIDQQRPKCRHQPSTEWTQDLFWCYGDLSRTESVTPVFTKVAVVRWCSSLRTGLPRCRDAARVAVRTAITTTVVTWEVAEAGADAYDGHHEENYEDVKIDCRS